jgi:hypothetical protein
MPEVQVVEVPSEIAAGPEYGLAVLNDADPCLRSIWHFSVFA